MINKSECILIGRIRKASGYEGELILQTFQELPEDIEEVEFFHLDIDGGLIPFFLEDIEISGNNSLRVKFLDVPTSDKARKLVGYEVYLEKSQLQDHQSEELMDSIEGYTVIDKTLGMIGKVSGWIQHPGQDLLQVESENHEILIPVVKHLILKVNPENKEIFVDLPEGLTTLNT